MTTFTYFKNIDGIYLKNLDNDAIVFVDGDEFDKNLKTNGFKSTFKEILNNIPNNINNNNKFLSIMIVTNMNCNLCCSYCFENNSRKNDFLKIEDISNICNNIKEFFEKGNYNGISITFTGGEPLLNFEFIKKLTEKIKNIFYNKIVYFSIITNGTKISEKMLIFFDKYRYNLQITFDGSKKFHDLERKTSEDIGTYEIILDNLSRILDYTNITLNIRFNITKFNFKSIGDVLDDLSCLGNNALIHIYFEFLDVCKKNIYYLTEREKINISKCLIDKIFKYDFDKPKGYISGGLCMYKNNTAYTINSDKNIYKCYSLVGYNNFIVSNLTNLVDISGTGTLCNNKACNVYELCYGGCPFSQFNELGIMVKNCRFEYLNFFNKYIFKKELEKELNTIVDIDDIHLDKV